MNVTAPIALRNAGLDDVADLFTRTAEAVAEARRMADEDPTLSPVGRNRKVMEVQETWARLAQQEVNKELGKTSDLLQPYYDKLRKVTAYNGASELAARLQLADSLKDLSTSGLYEAARKNFDVAVALLSAQELGKLNLSTEILTNIVSGFVYEDDWKTVEAAEQRLRALELAKSAADKMVSEAREVLR